MKKRSLAAKVGGILLATAMVLTAAIPAMADPTPTPTPTLVEPTKTQDVWHADWGSALTVHKFTRENNTNVDADGKKITDPAKLDQLGEPEEGVKFKLVKLNEELVTANTNAKMFDDDHYNDKASQALLEGGKIYHGTTDGNGEITAWDASTSSPLKYDPNIKYLPNGHYLLRQQEPGKTEPNEHYSMSVPTIITLPYGYTDASSDNDDSTANELYNYDVHVYPKNVSDIDIEKEVVEKDNVYQPGDTVNWEITGLIKSTLVLRDENGNPVLIDKTNPESMTYGKYLITDTLDTRLNYNGQVTNASADLEDLSKDAPNALKALEDATVSVWINKAVEQQETAENEEDLKTSLILGTDYTFERDKNNTQMVTLKLLEPGMKKAVDNGSNKIHITIPTTINDTAFQNVDNNIIKNGATLNFTPGGNPNVEPPKTTPDTPENPAPHISLAKIKITKVDGVRIDGKNSPLRLGGAQFKVASTLANAKSHVFLKAGKEDIVLTTSNGNGDPDLAKGLAYYSGLPIDETNGVVTKDADGQIISIGYYLVETKAPEGYELSNKVWNVEAKADQEQIISKITYKQFSGEQIIKNYKPGDPEENGHFNLPLTGGRGTMLLTIAGSILILGAAVVLVASRKKNHNK